MRKKKQTFIKDANRESCLNAISSRISRNGSCVITGDFGSGKTELLKQVRHERVVRVRSLGRLYEIMASMAGVHDAREKDIQKYLNRLCDHPRVIVIDEAHHLTRRVYPYLKIIMDTGSTVVLAGLPDLHDTLRNHYPDVLSRMTHLKVTVLSQDDIAILLPEFTPAAVSVLYGYKDKPDMREILENIAESCRDYARDIKLEKIDVDTVSLFVFEE